MKTSFRNMLCGVTAALCLLLAAAMPAVAAEPAAEPVEPMPYSIGVSGVIEEISDEQITLSYQDEQGNAQTIILNISAQTPCLDNETGSAVALHTLKAGDAVYAYHSPVTTRSLPPQSAAFAILTNVSGTPAHLHFIEQADAENGFRFLSDHGSIWVRVTDETELLPYLQRLLVKTDALTPGTLVLAWYDFVALSYPGQTTASRVVYLAQPADTEEIAIQINGEEIAATAKIEHSTLMLPLRAVAEQLGYTVSWDGAARSVRLNAAGGGQITAATTASLSELSVAPLLDQTGTTWISADYLPQLGVKTVNLDNNICRINK